MTFTSTKQFGQTKIRDLSIEVIINQYVTRFYVSMNNLGLNVLMQIGKTARNDSTSRDLYYFKIDLTE